MAGTWNNFNAPSGVSADTTLLLTDGSVLVHNADFPGSPGTGGTDWYRLTPDANGAYDTGTWSGALNMATGRQFFASGVLKDGCVFVVGGEYSNLFAQDQNTLGEIFDPATNLWTPMTKPTPAFDFIAGDCASCVMADGRVLIGGAQTIRTAIWDPALDLWTEAGLSFNPAGAQTKLGSSSEESWALMPDGTVVAVSVGNPGTAQKYVPSLDQWVNTGAVQNLVVSAINGTNVSEFGPQILLPDGRMLAIGGNGMTALYTSAANPGDAGAWTNGQNFPADPGAFSPAGFMTAIDAPGTLLPNGFVLCVAGNTIQEGPPTSYWSNPTTFFLYDVVGNSLTQLTNQPSTNLTDTWTGCLLLLPNGRVLYTNEANTIAMYTPDASELTPQNAWRPTISSVPPTLVDGHVYAISGTQLNGLSQANGYGDDRGSASNFPLVRVTDSSGKITYLRTSSFSTMAVATGGATVSADFEVPSDLPPGSYSLVVIANAIASTPMTVDVVKQACFILLERSMIGKGEIDAMIQLNGAPALVNPALSVIIEGFSANDLGLNAGNLNAPPLVPSVTTASGTVTAQLSGKVVPEDITLPAAKAQRFLFPFRLSFANSSVFPPAGSSTTLAVAATLTSGATVNGSANLILLASPNPYILHGDATNDQTWYLSVDTRVFQVKAGGHKFGAALGTSGNPADVATAFITEVIQNLNTHVGTLNPEFLVLPQDENTASLALAPADSGGTAVYNFALARVHYRDLNQDATDVRAFFRLWPAQQTNATYDPALYRALANPSGQLIPMLGVQGDEIMTIPFFANKRVNPSVVMSQQTDPANVATTIVHDNLGGEVYTFFGCWLDINQPGDPRFPARVLGVSQDGPFTGVAPLVPIQQLVRSAHQCLLVEISFPGLTIPPNSDPSNCDKLAQRNLAFVDVPNPGVLSSRVAPQTFEIRPSPLALAPDGRPDELMIEWGDTPHGSTATIYLPAASAAETLQWADKLYSTQRLSMVDAHTIACPTGGVTYIPIPQGSGPNFAGLMTIDLPPTLVRGQTFKIIVRQVTTAVGSGRATIGLQKGQLIHWRRVLGVFQLTIPVSTKELLLEPEERFLSILRWIELSIPIQNRWYLVFKRYVEQIGERVSGFGGDPDAIIPSPDGTGRLGPGSARLCCYIAWLAAVLLALFVVVLGFAGVPASRPVSVVLLVLFLVALLIWRYRCKPSFCALLSVLLFGLGLGGGIVGLLLLGGLATPSAPILLAVLAVLMALIVLIGIARRCLPFCREDE
jgi:hypothetical protein